MAPGRDIPRTLELVKKLTSTLDGDPNNPEKVIADSLIENPNLLDEIRIFAGWSDKRLYLSLSYIFTRTARERFEDQLFSEVETLCGCQPYDLVRHSTSFFKGLLRSKDAKLHAQSAEVIANLLAKAGIVDALRAYSSLNENDQHAMLKNLVFTKEAQQSEAKRRGHGAEGLIAKVLSFADCIYIPGDKAVNPMGAADPNIDFNTLQVAPRAVGSTMSCDIAVMDRSGLLRAWTVGLVQSSDPGQFGVDKSNTTTDIRTRLNRHNNAHPQGRVELWGIVDGVGYSENKNGTINRMLASFHQFFQVKSAYKAALAAHALGVGHVDGILFNRDFYDDRTIEQMCKYVPADVSVLDTPPREAEWISLEAGMARLFRRK